MKGNHVEHQNMITQYYLCCNLNVTYCDTYNLPFNDTFISIYTNERLNFNVIYPWYIRSNVFISAVQPVSDHLHFYPTINTMMDTLRKIWNVINHCPHLQTVRVSDCYFFAQKRKYFISLRKVNQAMYRRRMVNTC